MIFYCRVVIRAVIQDKDNKVVIIQTKAVFQDRDNKEVIPVDNKEAIQDNSHRYKNYDQSRAVRRTAPMTEKRDFTSFYTGRCFYTAPTEKKKTCAQL